MKLHPASGSALAPARYRAAITWLYAAATADRIYPRDHVYFTFGYGLLGRLARYVLPSVGLRVRFPANPPKHRMSLTYDISASGR